MHCLVRKSNSRINPRRPFAWVGLSLLFGGLLCGCDGDPAGGIPAGSRLPQTINSDSSPELLAALGGTKEPEAESLAAQLLVSASLELEAIGSAKTEVAGPALRIERQTYRVNGADGTRQIVLERLYAQTSSGEWYLQATAVSPR